MSPSARHPSPVVRPFLNPKPETRNPELPTQFLSPETLSVAATPRLILNPKPEALDHTPQPLDEQQMIQCHQNLGVT